MKPKDWLFYWSNIDIEHTYDKAHTYFHVFSEEIGRKNLRTILPLSALLAVLCAFVALFAAVMRAPIALIVLYFSLLFLELGIHLATIRILKAHISPRVIHALTVCFLAQILVIGAYIGTALSRDESASIFMVTLILAQVLFILPPWQTTALAALSTIGTLIASYHLKTVFFFRIDLLDCLGVFLLSIPVGWLISRTRVEEAFARFRAQRLNEELKRLSDTDQLTGLPNHRNFLDTYYAMFEESKAKRERIGVVMFDIDQFKAYNDNYGHVEGDVCLRAIGRILADCRGEGVYVCRYGGEEFLALLDFKACGRIFEVAEKVRAAVEAEAVEHAYSRVWNVVTVSAGGYAGVPEPDDMPMDFVDKADRAMYRSKMDGGNRTTLYEPDFEFRAEERTSRTRRDSPAGKGESHRRGVILIVDDSEVNRKILRRILSADYDILEAADGQEALAALESAHGGIAAVLLDIIMPVMDGYELLERIRKDELLSALPVIVMTSASDQGSEIKALSLGANDFLAKPFHPAVIKRRLDNAIRLRETAAIAETIGRERPSR